MTVVLCSAVPQGMSAHDAERELKKRFPANENESYFAGIINSKNEEGIKESLYALLILSQAIDTLTCRADRARLIFKRSSEGKPHFEGTDIYFNISHSKGYVACAVSDSGDVGIDIEASEIQKDKALKLADRYFSRSDIKKIKEYPESFARVWSEKEAQAKFLGVGLADFLKNERENCQNGEKRGQDRKIALHRFSYGSIPISLCTKRDFSTIIFKKTP